MQLECWQISGASFHFGRHGLGLEAASPCFPSDSLFSALVAVLARSKGAGAADAFMKPFLAGNPPFVISSTFPFAGEVRFFPVPLRTTPAVNETVPYKKIKKLKYLSEKLFRQVLEGTSLSSLYPPDPERLDPNSNLVIDDEILVGVEEIPLLPQEIQAEKEGLWKTQKRPRVTVDRITQGSTIFHNGQVTFSGGCGLWFAFSWLDATMRAEVEALLQLLADSGLGGERSAGLGACVISRWGSIHLPDPGSGPWVCLSRYIPAADEISGLSHPAAAYQIKATGGWVDSPATMSQRRRTASLITEGSVLGPQQTARPAAGQVVDVRPSYPSNPDPLGHPVFRNGLALGCGMKGAAG